MKGRVTLAGVSIILVVGAVIGAIVIHRNNSDNKDQLSTSSKTVSTICGPTDYKQACVQSLGSLATNQSATPKQLIEAAISATIQEVKSALEKSGKLSGNSASNGTEKMSMDDCQELLQFAVDELQASFSMVGDSELHTLKDRGAELLNWLSAVISYQQTCLDGISQPDLKNEMSNGLQNATQLTSNALAIISAISDILGTLNIPFNITSSTASSRRLLEQPNGTDTPDDRAYPSWFTAADRRLLASQSNRGVKPNAVVAKDGSGQFKTIGAALAAYPRNLRGRYVIYVKAGVYNEYLTVTKDQVNVFMYGDGPRKTLITGSKSYRDGISTYQTASFSAIGNGFIAKSIGFQNTAGPAGEQAVALRVQSDMSAFYNCRMDAYQDTLYVQVHHQFYRNCVISGTVDFIFGDAAAIIQNSLIIVRRPLDGQKNAVTAQGRSDKHETSGIVIHNCRIVPEQKLVPVRFQIPTYLGRPWKMYSRTVIMESTLGDLIQPAGWMEWAGNFALDTLDYREYANRGPGAVTSRRVRWKGYKVITNRNEALQFTAGPFIRGDLWLRYTGARYFLGFRP